MSIIPIKKEIFRFRDKKGDGVALAISIFGLLVYIKADYTDLR